jgi:hypothetical protein
MEILNPASKKEVLKALCNNLIHPIEAKAGYIELIDLTDGRYQRIATGEVYNGISSLKALGCVKMELPRDESDRVYLCFYSFLDMMRVASQVIQKEIKPEFSDTK